MNTFEPTPTSSPPRGPGAGSPDTAVNAEPERFRLGYRPELDGLRSFGIIMVMAAHSFWLLPAALRLPHGVFQMVDVFFVLSGFLLTMLLLEEREKNGRVSMKRFYQRRALRLLPSLFFVLSCYFIFTLVARRPLGPTLKSIAVVAGYVSNYVSTWTDHTIPIIDWDQTWSLAIEEQYYLIFFPILLVVLRNVRRYTTVIWMLIGVMVTTFLWRRHMVISRDESVAVLYAAYVRTDMRFDVLVVGPVIALLLHRGLRRTRLIGVLAFGGFVFAVWFLFAASLQSAWVFRWGLTPLGISWGCIVVWLMVTPPTFVHRMLRWAPVVWIGRLSYELYLWHMPVYLIVATTWGQGWWPLIVAVGISIVGAVFTFFVVAKPFRNMRRRQGAALRGESVALRPN